MDINLWIFIVYGHPLRNVLAWISVLGHLCGYSRLHELKTDIQKSWISMLISVDFWKSIHGFAMDSRTRGRIDSIRKLETNMGKVDRIATFKKMVFKKH